MQLQLDSLETSTFHHSPLCGKDADAGLTRLRVPTTSLGDGCSSVCRPCVGLHGNGQPAPPGRTPRMPSASTMSDWPVTWTALLNADEAAASLEWCWCCCCWWRCCNVDGKNTPPTPIPTGYRPAISDDIKPNLQIRKSFQEKSSIFILFNLSGDWVGRIVVKVGNVLDFRIVLIHLFRINVQSFDDRLTQTQRLSNLSPSLKNISEECLFIEKGRG